jgi:hypothetical protein
VPSKHRPGSPRVTWLAQASAAALALALPVVGAPAPAQQLIPTSNGFSFGTTSGHASTYRQVSRSEASVLTQMLTTNVSASGEDGNRFTINNPLEGFHVVKEIRSQTAGDVQTMVGSSFFSGTNYSVFSD